MNFRSLLGWLTILPIVCVLSCAEVAPPPGGEIDKKGPIILGTTPASGSVNVAPTDKIVISFSEPVQRPTGGQTLFLSPRQTQPPKVHWKSDRIEIELSDTLAPNQTYILSLSANITDLRNNKVDSLAPIAFSTGPALDTGVITGDVLEQRAGVGGIVIALFDSLPPDGQPYDSTFPQYLTSSGSDGRFTFRYLPSRSFYLIAFQDKNNNGLFNPSSERFAVPDRSVSLGDSIGVPNLHLQLAPAFPPSAIQDASFSVDGMVRLRFVGPIIPKFISRHPSGARIWLRSDSAKTYSGLAIAQAPEDTTRVLDLWLGPVDTGAYVGSIQLDSLANPMAIDTFEVKTGEDKTPPRITATSPAAGSHFRDQILLTFAFSEPIDTARLQPSTFTLIASPADTIPLTRTWSDLMHLHLTPGSLATGMSYTLTASAPDILDLHGTPVGDSVRVYTFSTLDPDSVGTAVGTVTLASDVSPNAVKLSFVRLPDQHPFALSLSDSKFSLSLPAGKYLLSGYIDRDSDGTLSRGSVQPYRYAETAALYPDTIAVRARFETTGINFEIR